MTYTIQSVMQTGKNSPQFGSEYYVKFNEMADTVPLWFKNEPAVDTPVDLEKVNGKWKKVKKEWNPQTKSQSSSPAETKTAPYARKDNSDGMRMGMCMNNAANYVNSLSFEKTLTDQEWALTVYAYASALYALGDLKNPEAATVGDVFNDN